MVHYWCFHGFTGIFPNFYAFFRTFLSSPWRVSWLLLKFRFYRLFLGSSSNSSPSKSGGLSSVKLKFLPSFFRIVGGGETDVRDAWDLVTVFLVFARLLPGFLLLGMRSWKSAKRRRGMCLRWRMCSSSAASNVRPVFRSAAVLLDELPRLCFVSFFSDVFSSFFRSQFCRARAFPFPLEFDYFFFKFTEFFMSTKALNVFRSLTNSNQPYLFFAVTWTILNNWIDLVSLIAVVTWA